MGEEGGGGWGGGRRLVIASATQPSCPRRVPIAKHCLFQENLPHRRRAFPNVAFLSNFRCQDEKSSVGNLLTRLKDTFIFDSRKQVLGLKNGSGHFSSEISGCQLIDPRVVGDGRGRARKGGGWWGNGQGASDGRRGKR